MQLTPQKAERSAEEPSRIVSHLFGCDLEALGQSYSSFACLYVFVGVGVGGFGVVVCVFVCDRSFVLFVGAWRALGRTWHALCIAGSPIG